MTRTIFLVLVLATVGCVALYPVSSRAAEYEGFDPYFNGENTGTGTNQCNGSHCCPGGRVAMIGLNLSANDFWCVDLPSLQKGAANFDETNNQSNDMLACPASAHMVGAHGENHLICSSNPAIRLGANQVHAIGSNVGYGGGRFMHGCTEISGHPVMLLTGIQDSKNLLNCAPIIGWTVPPGFNTP